MAAIIRHENVPGTIHLVDVIGTGTTANIQHVVLQPKPSADPEDPLNWSRPRKILAISMVYLYVAAIGIATAVQYSVLDQISEETGITVGQLNTGTGLMFLFLGWACLIWQPIALAYGRRGVYILSTILSIGPMLWTPYSKGAGTWYAHRILLGIFASPVESLPEVSVPDLFFAHERGSFMALYAFILFGSNFLAPFFAGFINDGARWQWVMYFGAIILAGAAVIMFFFMEDTIYFRKTTEGSESDAAECKADEVGIEKGPTVIVSNTDANVPGPTVEGFPGPRTYMQKLSLLTSMPGQPSTRQTLKQSWRALTIMFYFPTILWAGLLYGTNLSWYNVLNATMSSILGGAPYHFKPTMVGVAYLSPLVGAALACFWSGWVADKIMITLASRRNGVREPEQRLWTLLISALLTSVGLILWGVGASKGIHYMGLIIGVGMVTFGVVCGGSIALSYSVDCFKELAGETMISVIVIRNTLGFAFSYAITPWITASGLQNCFVAVSLVALVCTLSFLVMVVVGKRLRRFSSRKYWQYVEEARALA